LSAQVLRPRPGLAAWVNFLRAHSTVTRALNADLVQTHGLTINDYEVLLHLARADEHALRRVDLAERLLLTASGITRLLEGLEAAGYVVKRRCDSDARVTYAVITDAGLEKLRDASDTHLGGVGTLFESRFSEEELETLEELLSRLTGGGDVPDCSVPDA
jgi:DNA-binding MarR family transcriptional regulator